MDENGDEKEGVNLSETKAKKSEANKAGGSKDGKKTGVESPSGV